MVMRLVHELYDGEPASIPVDGSPEQAARLLGERTRRWAGLSLMDTVVGSVAVDRVLLRRSHRRLRNAFAPIFRGRFTVTRGRTYLTGKFVLRRSVQAFMTVWFGFIAVYCVASLAIGVRASSDRGAPFWLGIIVGMVFALGAIALGLLGFAFVRCSKRASKADIQQIVEHVKSSSADGAV